MSGFGLKTESTGNPNDVVFTQDHIARDIVRYFKPTGRMLDPCCGNGAFLKYMPGADWCEITKGKDFFEWKDPVDWIVSNPPYSIIEDWMTHSMKVADDIVYLIPLMKILGNERRLVNIYRWGGIVEVRLYGDGKYLGFPFGFACGSIHIRRGYRGSQAWSFYQDPKKNPTIGLK